MVNSEWQEKRRTVRAFIIAAARLKP